MFMRHYKPLVSVKYSWQLLCLYRDEVGQHFVHAVPLIALLIAGLVVLFVAGFIEHLISLLPRPLKRRPDTHCITHTR